MSKKRFAGWIAALSSGIIAGGTIVALSQFVYSVWHDNEERRINRIENRPVIEVGCRLEQPIRQEDDSPREYNVEYLHLDYKDELDLGFPSKTWNVHRSTRDLVCSMNLIHGDTALAATAFIDQFFANDKGVELPPFETHLQAM